MPIFSNIGALLRAPIGNNLENHTDDVENAKRHYAALGKYKPPVENGILDAALDDAIFNFQKDNKLKIDGIMNPGGETEAMLISQRLKLPSAEHTIKDNDVNEASAGAIPLMGVLALGLGMSMQGAADWWRKRNPDERDGIVRSLDYVLNHNKAGVTEADKLQCDLEFDENTERYKEITLRHGRDAGRICHEKRRTHSQ
jgi:hypothetical protein